MVLQRLLSLREDRGLTQQRLADELHISQRAYSHYEKGTRQIPLEILIQISLFYDVSTDYLLGLTDNSMPYSRNTRKLPYGMSPVK